MKRIRTPQEKKHLSLDRDRRETYGESDKGSRRIVPRRKAKLNRAHRTHATRLLAPAAGPDPEAGELERLEGLVRALRRNKFHKQPGTPLRDVIARALVRRGRIV